VAAEQFRHTSDLCKRERPPQFREKSQLALVWAMMSVWILSPAQQSHLLFSSLEHLAQARQRSVGNCPGDFTFRSSAAMM